MKMDNMNLTYKPGDRVKYTQHYPSTGYQDKTGTVKHIIDNKAWVKPDGAMDVVVEISVLRPIPAELTRDEKLREVLAKIFNEQFESTEQVVKEIKSLFAIRKPSVEEWSEMYDAINLNLSEGKNRHCIDYFFSDEYQNEK